MPYRSPQGSLYLIGALFPLHSRSSITFFLLFHNCIHPIAFIVWESCRISFWGYNLFGCWRLWWGIIMSSKNPRETRGRGSHTFCKQLQQQSNAIQSLPPPPPLSTSLPSTGGTCCLCVSFCSMLQSAQHNLKYFLPTCVRIVISPLPPVHHSANN